MLYSTVRELDSKGMYCISLDLTSSPNKRRMYSTVLYCATAVRLAWYRVTKTLCTVGKGIVQPRTRNKRTTKSLDLEKTRCWLYRSTVLVWIIRVSSIAPGIRKTSVLPIGQLLWRSTWGTVEYMLYGTDILPPCSVNKQKQASVLQKSYTKTSRKIWCTIN
jgi:hypothetical protein